MILIYTAKLLAENKLMFYRKAVGTIASGTFTFSTPRWRHFANILIFAFIAFLLFWFNQSDIDGSFESWRKNLFPILAGGACLFLVFVSARALNRRPLLVIQIDSQKIQYYSQSLQWDQISHFEIEFHAGSNDDAPTPSYRILKVVSWNPALSLSISDFAESKNLFIEIMHFLSSLPEARIALEHSGGAAKLISKLD